MLNNVRDILDTNNIVYKDLVESCTLPGVQFTLVGYGDFNLSAKRLPVIHVVPDVSYTLVNGRKRRLTYTIEDLEKSMELVKGMPKILYSNKGGHRTRLRGSWSDESTIRINNYRNNNRDRYLTNYKRTNSSYSSAAYQRRYHAANRAKYNEYAVNYYANHSEVILDRQRLRNQSLWTNGTETLKYSTLAGRYYYKGLHKSDIIADGWHPVSLPL